MLTLPEAAALLWPEGRPLSASSLRTAYRAGDLEVVMVARKILTNLEAIDAMLQRSRRKGQA
jgi:hypothetical protein